MFTISRQQCQRKSPLAGKQLSTCNTFCKSEETYRTNIKQHSEHQCIQEYQLE